MQYDVVVLGGGPAGYVSAIRASQLGASVCLIEAEELGGTCLNYGCIPTKTLLHNADFLRECTNMQRRGIVFSDPSCRVDLSAMMAHKNGIVKKLVAGIGSLLKSYKIEHIRGLGTVSNDLTVSVDGVNYFAKQLILAGGSEAIRPPITGVESARVLTSRELLGLEAVPQKLVIIGGGVIGIEMARIFSAFGTDVTILELAERLLPSFDEEISKLVSLQLKKDKIRFSVNTKVDRIAETADGLDVFTSDGQTHSADYALVSTGRRANLSGVKNLELKLERGFVAVDSQMRTSIPNVFAAGDINGLCMLAHAAFKMGEIATENALGSDKSFSPKFIPQVLYGFPEAVSVGMTESEAKKTGLSVKIGRFPFAANGRAVASDQGVGFVKLVCDSETDDIVGCQMYGPSVSELINEAAALMSLNAKAGQLAEIIHGHPCLSESIMEAAADVSNVSVHLAKK